MSNLFDIHGNPITKIPKKIGTIFFIGKRDSKPIKRGVGILYSARYGMDPTLSRGFWRRERKRNRRNR